jgi:hypothetical protein
MKQLNIMSKRFQECNRLVKLWRYRHYVYIPFRWLWGLHLFLKSPIAGSGKFSGKQFWSILVGSAQCDMKWYYTSEEVMESLKKK